MPLINPNTASVAELKSLPGITDAIAANVIAHRTPPYVSGADLLARAGFAPSSAIARMTFAAPLPAPVPVPVVHPPAPPVAPPPGITVVAPPPVIVVGPTPPVAPPVVTPPAPPTIPQPLVVTKGGTYTGAYSHLTVNVPASDTTPVVIDRLTLTGPGDLIIVNRANDITITNCTASTTPPGKFLVVWDAVNIVVEHNQLNGTAGILFSGTRGRVKSVHARFNDGHNITAATGPADKVKSSFIQLQNLHCDDVLIEWNHCRNEPGKSAVEDVISLMRAGGTPAHHAIVRNNCVDGALSYPFGSQYSGSGLMCADPGAASNVTDGGFADITENLVLASENQGIVAAGGHDLLIANNRAVNDGTTTKQSSVGFQVFNWANKTPPGVFKNIAVTGNFSSWLRAGKPSNFSFATPPTVASNNTAGTSTEAAERIAWAAKVAAAGVVIGPAK